MTTERAIEYAEEELARLELLFGKVSSSHGDYILFGESQEFLRTVLDMLKEEKKPECDEKPVMVEKPNKYNVSIAVDGRVDVAVNASSFGEAKEKAFNAFKDADLSMMDVVGFSPVSAERDDGEFKDF